MDACRLHPLKALPISNVDLWHSVAVFFELGLELDSAEVRGILLHDGQPWGSVVFDFFH